MVRVATPAAPAAAARSSVTYVRGGRLQSRARAGAVVLACWHTVIPYLCPELPAAQREALAYAVKVPIVYTNVLLRQLDRLREARRQRRHAPGHLPHARRTSTAR